MAGEKLAGRVTLVTSGTVHPILARLEGCGWLESRWEDIEPEEKRRLRRRYYRLSPEGAERPAPLCREREFTFP